MRLLRAKELAELLGVSRTTIWRYEREGLIPPRRKLNKYVNAWIEDDIHNWMNGAPAVVATQVLKNDEPICDDTIQSNLNLLRQKRLASN